VPGQNRGVAHAPAPLPAVTRHDGRAAQNAARIKGDRHLQLAGAEGLPGQAMESRSRLAPRCLLGFGTPIQATTTAFCSGPPRGVSSCGLQPWVDGFAFQGEDAKNALVNSSQRFSLDEPFESFNPKRKLAQRQ
jgi:hypothetical protein